MMKIHFLNNEDGVLMFKTELPCVMDSMFLTHSGVPYITRSKPKFVFAPLEKRKGVVHIPNEYNDTVLQYVEIRLVRY